LLTEPMFVVELPDVKLIVCEPAGIATQLAAMFVF
jgi:hypothetical protein